MGSRRARETSRDRASGNRSLRASAGASITEAVLADAVRACLEVLVEGRRTNVVAIEADGRQAFLYELRPQPEALRNACGASFYPGAQSAA